MNKQQIGHVGLKAEELVPQCSTFIALNELKGQRMNQLNETFNVCSVGKAGLGMTVDDPFFMKRGLYNPFRFQDPETGYLYVVDYQPSIGKSSYIALIKNEFLNSNKEC